MKFIASIIEGVSSILATQSKYCNVIIQNVNHFVEKSISFNSQL